MDNIKMKSMKPAKQGSITRIKRVAIFLAFTAFSGFLQIANADGARGLPVEECHRQANASNLGDKLNAIPRSDTVLLLRGVIHNLDFLIRTYTQCLPEQGSQDAINGWKTQREQSLRTCRQISSSDNCLDSPFNAAANARAHQPASATGGLGAPAHTPVATPAPVKRSVQPRTKPAKNIVKRDTPKSANDACAKIVIVNGKKICDE